MEEWDPSRGGKIPRGGEYWHSTHGIEYTIRHHEDPFATMGQKLPCTCFLAFNIGGQGRLHMIPCRLLSRAEDYYLVQQRHFKALLLSHYPHLSRGCAAKVTERFMEIVHIANATHACFESGVPVSVMNILFVVIQPHQHAAVEIKTDGPMRWPATRASVVELLMKASTTTAEEEEEEECAICMEEMRPSKTLAMPCSHTFHLTCLLPWLDDNHSCPLCRYQLPRAHYRSLE